LGTQRLTERAVREVIARLAIDRLAFGRAFEERMRAAMGDT
jgi:hypothetical protein